MSDDEDMRFDNHVEDGLGNEDGEAKSQTSDAAKSPQKETAMDIDFDDDMSNLSDESDLSDVDEAQLANFDTSKLAIGDRPVAVDDSNVALLGVHKRKRPDGAAEEGGAKKKKRETRRAKPKKSRKRVDDDDDVVLSGGEELPEKRERKKRDKPAVEKKRTQPKKAEEDETALSPEERRRRALDKAMDEALKNPNRRRVKTDGVDLEQSYDRMIEEMRQRMVNAARNDNEARKDGRVATEKLKLLPEVMALLSRTNLTSSIVDPDSGLIEAIKFFLEPLSDGSLPAYNVQRDLFTALTKLQLSQDTLLQSGIGKVTLFYSKSKRPETTIKRMAERLLWEWSRPILGLSDDPKKKEREVAIYDPAKRRKRTAEELLTQALKEAREAAHAPPVRNPNRARVQTGKMNYEIAPKAVNFKPSVVVRRPGAAGEAYFKKLTSKHNNSERKAK